jgi:hypothetical protein
MKSKRIEPEEDEDDVAFTQGVDRQEILDRLGLMTEVQLAAIYGCGRRAMQNRPKSELPPFFRAGGKRLFFRDDVIKFFRSRTND